MSDDELLREDANMILDNVLKIPTRSDFHSADLNGLLFDEWNTWAKGQ